MMQIRFTRGQIYLLLVLVAGLLALTEYGGLSGNRGALLLTLVFWAGLAQGCIALVAACELTNARWIDAIRKELLCVHPLLLFVAVLLVLAIPRLELYPWHAQQGLWLNPPFFIVRNLLLLLLAWFTGRAFALSSMREHPTRRRDAIIYLFVFVACQSLLAFDLVMSLEYPWMSSLLGGFFFIEALYAGVALAILSLFLLHGAKQRELPRETAICRRDLPQLLFGFSVLWAGLFFAQFMLLWYGNLPEETGFVVTRMRTSPYAELSLLFLAGCFLFPFALLMSQRIKARLPVVAVLAALVLTAILIERLVFMLPAAPLHSGVTLLQNALVFCAWLILVHGSTQFFPPASAHDSTRAPYQR